MKKLMLILCGTMPFFVANAQHTVPAELSDPGQQIKLNSTSGEGLGSDTSILQGYPRIFATKEECERYMGWFWVEGGNRNCYFDFDVVNADSNRDGIPDEQEPDEEEIIKKDKKTIEVNRNKDGSQDVEPTVI